MSFNTDLKLAYQIGYDDALAGRKPDASKVHMLGQGTCHNVHEPPKGTTFWPCPHFKCSECGEVYVSMKYVFFCPYCGRKVVDE